MRTPLWSRETELLLKNEFHISTFRVASVLSLVVYFFNSGDQDIGWNWQRANRISCTFVSSRASHSWVYSHNNIHHNWHTYPNLLKLTWQFVFVNDMKKVTKNKLFSLRSVMNVFIPCVPSRFTENWHVSQLFRGQSWQNSLIISHRNNLLWAQAAKNNNAVLMSGTSVPNRSDSRDTWGYPKHWGPLHMSPVNRDGSVSEISPPPLFPW